VRLKEGDHGSPLDDVPILGEDGRIYKNTLR